MKAALSLRPVQETSREIPHLIDHRYFYDDINPEFGERAGAFSCGLARDAATGMLLANNVHFAGVDFLMSLSKYIDNPSVAGFMVEKAVLSSISLYGLNIVGIQGSMKVESYKGRIESLYLKGDLVLHLPGAFNYKTIDRVIVWKASDGEKSDGKKGQLLVFPLQVTVAKMHKDSHATFFREWKQWSADLGEFDVVPEFI
jgi:hypothetical protein